MGLRPPAAMPVQPDSPGPLLHDYSGDRVDVHRTPPPVASSPSRPADTSGVRQASISDIINALRRWNLKCSGSEAEAFLIRIEEWRELFPVSDADLFQCSPFFLSGTALFLYRSRRSDWQTWDQFVVAWPRCFGDPDFHYALWDEILRRTQGNDEPVADYLTCMQALFGRLSPPWDLTE